MPTLNEIAADTRAGTARFIGQKLRKNGIGRDVAEPRMLNLYFNLCPTDDEMRAIDDAVSRALHLLHDKESING